MWASAYSSDSAVKILLSELKVSTNFTKVLVHVLIEEWIDVKALTLLKHCRPFPKPGRDGSKNGE
jgi:hypothetical protein